MSLVFLLHLFCTWFMTGVIWVIQVVHYPLFRFADPSCYSEFQAAHMRKVTWIVFPAMSVELLTAIALAYRMPIGIGLLLWINLVLLGTTWCVTALVQVPQHAKLLESFSQTEHLRLVRGNWSRTIVWSLRSLLLSLILWHLLEDTVL